MALAKKPVNGMKDILPEEMKLRDYVISVIKDTYAGFGFTSIETPCMENIGNLSNKQGGENEKLIFKILRKHTNLFPRKGNIGNRIVAKFLTLLFLQRAYSSCSTRESVKAGILMLVKTLLEHVLFFKRIGQIV